jgi:hypothetical protein
MKFTKKPTIVDAFKMSRPTQILTQGETLTLEKDDWLVIDEGEFYYYDDRKFRDLFIPYHTDIEFKAPGYKTVITKQPEKLPEPVQVGTGLQGVLDKAAAAEKEKEKPEEKKNVIYSTSKQIPFNCKTEKREYDRAWKLCKKYGLPYPEAVKKAREESEKKETSKAFSIGVVNLPAELKPLEEKKAFFKGASVIQVAGKKPYGLGCGEIIEIRANKDIVVEFYHGQKTLKREEIAFYQPPATQKARGIA